MKLADIRALEEATEADILNNYDASSGAKALAKARVDLLKLSAWPALVELLEEARDVLMACTGTGPIVGEARRRLLARIDGDLSK